MLLDPRAALQRLIEERGEDYAGLSRLIGRNAAYMQQFIKRGSPRRLAEADRQRLAAYFGVSEELLGGPPAPAPVQAGLFGIPRITAEASAGPGTLASEEAERGRIGFDPAWLRRMGASDPSKLSLIRVGGDSMAPTLAAGDEILVDAADGAARLRDGIYVLRIDETLMVKRLAPSPMRGRVAVSSDNQDYPSWPDCPLADLHIVGRVIWVGRSVR
jgi:phage repressor protein C with HTH and peptisase S24 domain